MADARGPPCPRPDRWHWPQPRPRNTGGKQIIIKGGVTNGLDVDQQYELYSVSEDIIDEKTKESLGSEEVLLGDVVVKRVTEKVSYVEALDKLEDKPKAGDIIRRK